jgi:hypothetical protein
MRMAIMTIPTRMIIIMATVMTMTTTIMTTTMIMLMTRTQKRWTTARVSRACMCPG